MRINRIDKSIYNKIDILEANYPPMNFNIQKHIIEIITPIENYFRYKIRDRIKIPNYKYLDEDTLDREIYSFLTTEELKKLVHVIMENKQKEK